MAEKIKITISPTVAAYARSGTSLEVRVAGCAAAGLMPTTDRLMLLFCLSKDTEPSVRAAALSCLKDLPLSIISEYVASLTAHPVILDALPRLCNYYPEEAQIHEPPLDGREEVDDTFSELPDQPDELVEEEPVKEEGEEFLGKFKLAQLMGIGEKIKMALTGDKEWRSILVKDSNKLVSGSVIKNPRISDAEILTLVKSGIQNDEIMRLICANKEWLKNYPIRKALIENNRTPVQNALKYLGTMGEKDLASFAKSKNIASVISTMAKRLLLNKKK
jgi:hypothetical protein